MKHASLNHVYRLVWNEITNAYVAVAEHTAGRGKRSSAAGTLVASVLLGAASLAHADPGAGALPSGGSIAAGQGSITQSGNAMTVTQGSDRLVLNWGSFDIGAKAGVSFVQPGANSIALNRVTGGTASSILGSLNANGQVWLVNPSGIVFGAGAQVDVGGLVASSLSITDSDFLGGRHRFTGGAGAGAVVNQGRISANGGYVALIAPQARNEGTISTAGGTTALAAGDSVKLDLADDGLVSVKVERSVVDALAENTGRITAEGGLVVLTARGANKALDSVVNNSGVIEAKSLVAREGRILLDGDAVEGATKVTGTLDVSSDAGKGGAITVTGRDITLANGATLDASGATGGGTVLVGGGFQGKNAAVANAKTTSADASVSLRADAKDAGNGGQVVVWSDETTTFAGKISARGGERSGDGGSLEVSGKQDLHYTGRADARATNGRTGDLLLDPATITVMGGGTGGGAVNGSVVYEKDLEAQNANVLLDATTQLTFQDLNLNGGDGKITLGNNISFRAEVGSSTANNISFANANNTIEVFGTGSIYLQAGSTGTGSITNAPNLIAHGAGTNPGALPGHDVTVVGSGTPSAGSITLWGADGVTVGGSLTTNGGYVRVWADSDNASGGGFSISAPVTTNGGNFHVSAGTGAVDLNSNMTLGTGRLLFQSDGSYTNGTRTLGGLLQASGAVNVNTPFNMNAGAGIYTDGVITFSNTVNLNTGSGSLTLRAQAIDFTAATLNNLSTASMILQPANPSTSMVLGDANGFASATTLAKLPGIKNLTIGRTDGTGTTSVASNFSFSANGMMEIVNKNIDINAGSLTNTSGNVTLTGDNINISQQITANGGAGSVTIRQMTASNAINLGTGLSSAAVGQINAATLLIGRADGGNLTFDSDISTTATSVHVLSGGTVTAVNGGVSAANLAITAGGGATLSDSTFDFTTLALAVGGNTTITKAAGGFGFGTVAGISGLAINSGTNANVTLNAPGTITMNAPVALNGNTSTVTLQSSAVSLASATLSGQSNASFVLEPLNAGDNIDIGGAYASAASVNRLTGSRNVTVGRSDGTGTTNVNGALSLNANGTLTVVNGTVANTATVANSGGNLRIDSRTGNLQLGANVGAIGQVTLAAANATTVGSSGSVTGASLLVDAANAAVALTSAGNTVGTIASNSQSLTYQQANSLTVGTVGGVNGITANGAVQLRTTGAAADITLNQAVSGTSAGHAVTLAAGRNFVNSAGASAIVANGGGDWLVYSGSPLNDVRGGLSPNFKQYNTVYGGSLLGTGNGFVYRVAPVITVGLTGTTSKVYDGNDTATLATGNYTTSGAIDGDTFTYSTTGATYNNKNVATGKNVTANGIALTGAANGAVTVYGYQLASTSASANIGTITKATLTVGATTVSNKVYDATDAATVTTVALGGVIGNDVVSATANGHFDDKNVGTGKNVNVTGIALTGGDANNYQVNTTSTTGAADITKATLTLTAATFADKVYDATTTATLSSATTSGRLGTDSVTVTGNGAFADRHVGNGKAVSSTGLSLTGTDAGNYDLVTAGVSSTANITPATLSVDAVQIANKAYDGSTTAAVEKVFLGGVYAGDLIGTNSNGTFADKNVGQNKSVSVSGITLTGPQAGNYQLAQTTGAGTASITPRVLSVGQVTVSDKVYDGTTTATIGNVVLTGMIGSDNVGTSGNGSFLDKNAGTNKTVTVGGLALTGTDAGNYTLDRTAAVGTGNITPAALTLGTATIASKVYDGTTAATVSGVALNGLVGNDTVGVTGSGQFDNKNVGNGKSVAVSVSGLSGADAGNYTLAGSSTTGSGNITPATISVGGANVASKVYDGGTSATVSGVTFNGVVSGDAVSATATGQFADKNAGTNKAVAVSAGALSGADAGNYVLAATPFTARGTITPAALTVNGATFAGKVYDGTTSAVVTGLSFSGLIGGDVVGTTSTGAFADKNVGQNKAVTVTTAGLTGTDAGNYALSGAPFIGHADITPASLSVGSATVAGKVYDGNTAAKVTGVAFNGLAAGDVVTGQATGQFADKNVGNGKSVAISVTGLSGADAGNYVFGGAAVTGHADITPASVSVGSATVAGKTYDGTTAATLNGYTLSGVVAGDTVGANASAVFADKNAGTGKDVLVTTSGLNGADAGNYKLAAAPFTAQADIARAALTVNGATFAGKVYDGTTAATVSGLSFSGLVAGDVVNTTSTGAFADKNVGQNKAVTVTTSGLTGADAGNYTLSGAPYTGRADITPATLTLGSATIATKVYDGTTAATVSSVALQGAVAGDQLGTTATGAFVDKNAGTNKAVTVNGVGLTGADAGNYVLSGTSTTGRGDIGRATLTASGATVADKTFDGTTTATVGGVTLTGVVGSDQVSGRASGNFADPNVGSNKVVTVSGITLSGADAGNYTLASSGTTGRASITPAATTGNPPVTTPSTGLPSTTTVSTDALAALTSPQAGSNGTTGGGSSSGNGGANGGAGSALSGSLGGSGGAIAPSGLGVTQISPDLAGAGGAGAAGFGSGAGNGGAAGNAGNGGAGNGNASGNGTGNAGNGNAANGGAGFGNTGSNAGASGNAGNGSGSSGLVATGGAAVSLPETVLSQGGQVSIATGNSEASAPVSASLPVYSKASGAAIRGEGQYIVTDSGGSLALAANGSERTSAPSLTQTVQRSAQASLPITATESATIRVDLLADGTLVVNLPAQARPLSAETLAAYGLVVARKGLSLAVDNVRAVVLQFAPDAETATSEDAQKKR